MAFKSSSKIENELKALKKECSELDKALKQYTKARHILSGKSQYGELEEDQEDLMYDDIADAVQEIGDLGNSISARGLVIEEWAEEAEV